jgi:hypothetical protein
MIQLYHSCIYTQSISHHTIEIPAFPGSFFVCFVFGFFGFVCGTKVWAQGLHLEPLHQPYFCDGFFQALFAPAGFKLPSSWSLPPEWLGLYAWATGPWLHSQVFAALFTIAKLYNQPKFPSTDEWIKKMWSVYTKECSNIKKNKIVICRKVDGTEDLHVKWNKPDSERQIPCFFLHAKLDLKKKKKVLNYKGNYLGRVGDKRSESLLVLFLQSEDTTLQSANLEEAPHQNLTFWHPDLGLPASRAVWTDVLVPGHVFLL